MGTLIFFFVANYMRLGWAKSTTNQLVSVPRAAVIVVAVQIVAEVGASIYILFGFILDQLCW